jgi:ActR/RegA family two-component response regulator
MAKRTETTTVWQTVYEIASSRQATKSGKDFLSKGADRVIEAFHDAEIEAMVEDAISRMCLTKFQWPD